MEKRFEERLAIRTGVLFCAAGLALNERVVAVMLGQPSFESAALSWGIRALDVFLVTAGALVLLLRKRQHGANLLLLAVSLLVMAPICGEISLRIGIALRVDSLRDPRLYTGWTDDEEVWKLRYLWRDEDKDLWAGPLEFDPTFGWTMGDAAVGDCGDCEDPVLLYGDSFLFGTRPSPENKRIPQLLARFLPRRSVANYAANGYGLDQIFLRFRATYPFYKKPTIVIGLMTLDLDRSIFSVRDAPKPYFRLTDGELVLAGVPVERDAAAWHRRNPPRIRSFLLSALVRPFLVSGLPYESEVSYGRSEKKQLNARILEELDREAVEHGLPLLVVVLYPPWEIGFEGWREPFLKRELERLRLPYIDTKKRLLQRSADAAEKFYFPEPNFHPNSAGNQVIATAIARYLKRRGRYLKERGSASTHLGDES